MGASDLPPKYKALLRAFTTHAVWFKERLYAVGYDVATGCPQVGGPRILCFTACFTVPALGLYGRISWSLQTLTGFSTMVQSEL